MSAPPSKAVINKLITAAKADLGVTEEPPGSNRGKRVEQMLALCGLSGGFPWCAAAVSQWGVDAFGKAWPLPITADCDTLLDFAKRKGILYDAPEAGDVFLKMKSPRDAHHTGIVIDAEGAYFKSIEGNTNEAGEREGTTVRIQTRQKQEGLYKFVRWSELMESAEADGWPLKVGAKSLTCVLQGGVNYAPLREYLSALFDAGDIEKWLSWDADTRQPLWQGHHLDFACIQSAQGAALAPVRALASWMSLTLTIDAKGKKLEMKRL